MRNGQDQLSLWLPLVGVVIGGLLATVSQCLIEAKRSSRERETIERVARASSRVWLEDIWRTRVWIESARANGLWPDEQPPRILGDSEDFRRLAASATLATFRGGGFGRAAEGHRAVQRARALHDAGSFDPEHADWDRVLNEMDAARTVLLGRFEEGMGSLTAHDEA